MTIIQKQKPRVLYLDVDDTLLVWTIDVGGFAAPKAAEFINWALKHFEIRWLTLWCPSGQMRSSRADELSYKFNNVIEPDVFKNDIINKIGFQDSLIKTDGIDFNDSRPWVWVEDHILEKEQNLLRGRKMLDRWLPTNVSIDPTSLQNTWAILCDLFDLPDAPAIPYSIDMKYPIIRPEDFMK